MSPAELNRGNRAIRLATTLTVGYLACTLVPLIGAWQTTTDGMVVAGHASALMLGVVLLRRPTDSWIDARQWYGFAMVLPLYLELNRLIVATGRTHQDALAVQWEHMLFPAHPSATLALHYPWWPLSEVLHLCYASYYVIVSLPLLLLYVRRQHEAFAATTLAMSLVYLGCFTTYVLFPVDGPRFVVGAAAAPDGPIRSFVLWLLASASSRGTAFPSSHVAAAVVASVFAWRYQRRLGAILGILTTGLTIGTVYGGFHYAIDATAGVIAGVAMAIIAIVAWNALGSRA